LTHNNQSQIKTKDKNTSTFCQSTYNGIGMVNQLYTLFCLIKVPSGQHQTKQYTMLQKTITEQTYWCSNSILQGVPTTRHQNHAENWKWKVTNLRMLTPLLTQQLLLLLYLHFLMFVCELAFLFTCKALSSPEISPSPLVLVMSSVWKATPTFISTDFLSVFTLRWGPS